jgi:hypothetical protein
MDRSSADERLPSCATMGTTDTATSPLSSYARNEYSQYGEDGILLRIFDLLGVDRGWCAEFGAWDGIYLSNTHNLIKNHGWQAVLIEADPTKFRDLQNNAPVGVTCLNRRVSFDPPDNLDELLAQTDAPADLDLLSIDIDGNDYHVWDTLHAYRPKIVVIEINPTMPNHIEFVQARDMNVKHGSSLLAMTNLGLKKGYQLAAATTCNAILAREDVFPALGVTDNAPDTLRPGREDETSLLHLFDGTLALAGRTRHPWNGMELRDRRVQILPARLRTYTPEASQLMRKLQSLWAWLYTRRP